jgi:hypothetical protein
MGILLWLSKIILIFKIPIDLWNIPNGDFGVIIQNYIHFQNTNKFLKHSQFYSKIKQFYACFIALPFSYNYNGKEKEFEFNFLIISWYFYLGLFCSKVKIHTLFPQENYVQK